MDGTTWVGIGVLVGPPLAVVLSKLMPARAPNGMQRPGVSEICRTHGQRIGKTEVLSGKLEEATKNTSKSLERIDKKLERIEERLENLARNVGS